MGNERETESSVPSRAVESIEDLAELPARPSAATKKEPSPTSNLRSVDRFELFVARRSNQLARADCECDVARETR